MRTPRVSRAAAAIGVIVVLSGLVGLTVAGQQRSMPVDSMVYRATISLPEGVCDIPGAYGSFNYGTWSREGVILFGAGTRPEIQRVSASGGTPTPVTTLDTGNQQTRVLHINPFLLPDGRHFFYRVQGGSG